MQFLKLYRKAKKVFIRPKLKFFIGKWINENNLPVWRYGNFIRLTRNYSDYSIDENITNNVKYKWTEFGKKNHPILSKICRPCFHLPLWLSFYFFDSDIYYKYKYDEVRYEYPAHITLVIFGLCVSVTSYIPLDKDDADDMNYWEGLIMYLDNKGDLEKTCIELGQWGFEGNKRWAFKPYFLRNKKDRETVIRCQKEYEKQHNDN